MLLLCACTSAQLQTTGDVLDIIAPPPTPQEQCANEHGQWKSITTYDVNNGNPITTNECIHDLGGIDERK
jgi:hypothetical protein